MQFTVEFYETAAGKCPLVEFLEAMRLSDPGDFKAVMRGLDRLKDRQNHRPPLCKPLDDGILELRHVGKLNTRVLWFFVAGQRIAALHGIRNKAQAIPLQDLKVAHERRQDWLRRLG
jgi:phage-related protein